MKIRHYVLRRKYFKDMLMQKKKHNCNMLMIKIWK